jgi:hypothetical protein
VSLKKYKIEGKAVDVEVTLNGKEETLDFRLDFVKNSASGLETENTNVCRY